MDDINVKLTKKGVEVGRGHQTMGFSKAQAGMLLLELSEHREELLDELGKEASALAAEQERQLNATKEMLSRVAVRRGNQ